MKLSDVIVEPPETAPRTHVLVVCPNQQRVETAKGDLLRNIEIGPRLCGVQTYSPRHNSVGVICLDGSHVLYDFRRTNEVVEEIIKTADGMVYAPHVRGMIHDYWIYDYEVKRTPSFDLTPTFPASQACITRRGW